jgi:antitoxin component HigA of HigAB toxin-antitoxin module
LNSSNDATVEVSLTSRTEDAFEKLLTVIERYYSDDEEKKNPTVLGLALLYVRQLARKQQEYEEKLTSLATKYPKQVRAVLLQIQQKGQQKPATQ